MSWSHLHLDTCLSSQINAFCLPLDCDGLKTTPIDQGKDRRCVYSDGDIEDLSLADLEQLVELDPNNKRKRTLPTSTRESTSKMSDPITIAAANFPRTEKDYIQLLLQSEQQRDARTAHLLAQDILTKSAMVDDLVAKLPGMGRTRQMQMELIEKLIKSNHDVTRELEEAYAVAKERREEVRVALEECTCLALGVEEETSN